MEAFRENQVSDEHDQENGNQLYLDFSEIYPLKAAAQ
jgi:hypothetical protein